MIYRIADHDGKSGSPKMWHARIHMVSQRSGSFQCQVLQMMRLPLQCYHVRLRECNPIKRTLPYLKSKWHQGHVLAYIGPLPTGLVNVAPSILTVYRDEHLDLLMVGKRRTYANTQCMIWSIYLQNWVVYGVFMQVNRSCIECLGYAQSVFMSFSNQTTPSLTNGILPLAGRYTVVCST